MSVWALVLLATVLSVRGSNGATHMPDASTGVIDGHPAILFWPQIGDDAVADVAGCEVHLVPTDTTRDIKYGCGEWFVPALGRYTAWIESREGISSMLTVFNYGGGPFHGSGTRVLSPIVPAGFVRVQSAGAGSDVSIRLLSLGASGYPFERRVALEQGRKGIRMPARRTLVGVFDADGNALALARPVVIRPDGVESVNLDVQAHSATTLAVLARPAMASGPSRAPVTVSIELAGGRRSPDVLQESPSRIFAVWFDLPAETASLRVDSPGIRLDPVPLSLVEGRVVTVRRTMEFRTEGQPAVATPPSKP